MARRYDYIEDAVKHVDNFISIQRTMLAKSTLSPRAVDKILIHIDAMNTIVEECKKYMEKENIKYD